MTGPRRSRVPKNPLDCHERALRLLSVRSRSRRELQTRLLRAGFDAVEVEGELERLESVGLVDDERFAREFAEHALSVRRAGSRGVAMDLAAKGVPRGTIDRTLDGSGDDDEGRASALASERVARLAGLPPAKAYQRLVGLLVRRGHDPDVARRVARRALQADDERQ